MEQFAKQNSLIMKERILTGWTFIRGLYLVMGILVIIQSAKQQQWFGVLFGCYFASMGLFSFGCATGNCFGGNCAVEPKQNSTIQVVDFEEKNAN